MNTSSKSTFESNNPREIDTYNMLYRFYQKRTPAEIAKVADIINETSDISLRILDWFATKYSNKKKILIRNEHGYDIDVHISYKAQLKSYKKKYFDPFRRHKKFNYHFKNPDVVVTTTIGQLNFLCWVLENKIINFIENNYDVIKSEMVLSNKNDKKRKKEKIISNIKNTNNIGININKKIQDEQIKITLTFD